MGADRVRVLGIPGPRVVVVTVTGDGGGLKNLQERKDKKGPLESHLFCLLFVLLNWILLVFYGNKLKR